jgi:nucleotide-binding universal stress UspA family protein
MMFKNLLVHIPTEQSPRPAVDGSISLAMICGAHVDAISVGYASANNVPFVAEGGAAVAAVFEIEYERALERANTALAVFEVAAKAANISYKSRAIAGSPAETTEFIGGHARLCDLTVVSQPEPDSLSFDNLLPQEILFQAGAPVLVMPYTFRGALRIGRIGICWDGSRLAARALRDAMPLLSQADKLSIIAVNKSVSDEASPARLAARLASLGLPAKIIAVQSDHSNIQPTILSVAADEGLDMLVMGGYGHSRLQETVLGGVTREMFRSMTVPTLMSH